MTGMNIRNSILVASTALLLAGSASAQRVELGNRTILEAALDLKNGEFVWAPERSPDGPALVVVNLATQRAVLFRNGLPIAASSVSSGAKGTETPTGVFTILQKNAKHKSNLYNDAPMPYMQRLTWDGVALHAGNLPGYPQSHGCVRMPMAFAEKLFKSTEKGGTVVVAGKAGAIQEAPTAGILAPMDTKGQALETAKLAENEEYRWNPEKSPTGPLTILVSRPDRRMIVLRNGVEIGRSRIDLPAMDFGSHVLTYAPDSTGAAHWIVVGVPGADENAGTELDPRILEMVKIPQPFQDAVRSQIVSGTTVLVTRTPLTPENSGRRMTIMDAAK